MLWLQLIGMAANKISGVVMDETDGSPLATATVALYDNDSTLVQGVTTDTAGRFELRSVANGDFLLQISYVGYTTQALSLTNLCNDLHVGEIHLQAAATALSEVVVQGEAVVRKVDREMILPTAAQRQASANGLALLQQLQVGSLQVNPLTNSVSNGYGEAVQLRINGVEATTEEVVALRPGDIVRIEHHPTPGLRYGSVAAVVDYIVKRREAGGNLSANLSNGITTLGYGEYNLAAKYYYNRSSFSAVASMSRRDLTWNRENSETFCYPDFTLKNSEIGEPTPVAYSYTNIALSYNYTQAERSMLNVTLRNHYSDMPHSPNNRTSTLLQGEKSYRVTDRQQSEEVIPALDIYYQLNMKGDRHLYLDLVGTYLSSNSSRTFSMSESGAEASLIRSQTEGDKYSLIGEAIYEHPLGRGKLTAGVKHTQAYTANVYNGDVNSRVNMHTAESYAFAEYQATQGKLNYTVGLGGMRTYYKQEEQRQEKFILRPTFTLSYQPTKQLFLRYRAYLSGYAPSLANLSDVRQDMDIYQARRGNPALRSVTFFSNELSTSLRSKYVNIELSGRYSYDDRPIMEETLLEGDKFIRTYANQQGFHRLNLQGNLQIRPYKEYLSISLQPFFNRYIGYGNSYTHTHSNWGLRSNLLAMYRQWSLMFRMYTSYHNLYGETINKGEAIHMLALGYRLKRCSLQAVVMNPFSDNYKQSIENVSRLAPYSQAAFSKDFARFFILSASFNLDFGKPRRDAGKRINNSDTDTGILSGSK